MVAVALVWVVDWAVLVAVDMVNNSFDTFDTFDTFIKSIKIGRIYIQGFLVTLIANLCPSYIIPSLLQLSFPLF